jgi:hypothetical protein
LACRRLSYTVVPPQIGRQNRMELCGIHTTLGIAQLKFQHPQTPDIKSIFSESTAVHFASDIQSQIEHTLTLCSSYPAQMRQLFGIFFIQLHGWNIVKLISGQFQAHCKQWISIPFQHMAQSLSSYIAAQCTVDIQAVHFSTSYTALHQRWNFGTIYGG